MTTITPNARKLLEYLGAAERSGDGWMGGLQCRLALGFTSEEMIASAKELGELGFIDVRFAGEVHAG